MNNDKDFNTNQPDDTVETEKSESTLFSAPAPMSDTLNKRQRAGSMKKQRRALITLAILVAAAICLYFFVVKPIVEYVEETYVEPVELLEGEVLGTNDRILLFEHLERSKIQEIEVHNEFGEFGFYWDEKDESFYVTGHPEAPYDKEKISSLIVSAGYTLSMTRVTTDCEDFSEFGLAEKDNPAWYTVTSREGEKHTVYIGDAIPTGAGYYVRYKDRDAVYVLSADLATTLLQPLENMITPTLALPMNTNDYFTIKNFTIMDGDEVSIMLTYLDEEEKEAAASMSAYKMLAPANYTVNDGSYSIALEVLTAFQGTSTLVYAPEKEDMKEYGLYAPTEEEKKAAGDKPIEGTYRYMLYYEYQDIAQYILLSDKNENGNYYAYSLLFNLITELDGSTMEWLEWDLIKWVDSPIFMMNINDVKTITVDSPTAKRVFDLVGEAQELVVTERATGFKPEVFNFRQFYKTLLSVDMQDYVGMTEEEIAALTDDDLQLTLTIETRAGQKRVYKFYPYSTRRSYYTVDGKGEFYVQRDMATKVITDAEKVMTNTEVDSEAHH